MSTIEINDKRLASSINAKLPTWVVWLMDGMPIPEGVTPEDIPWKIRFNLRGMNYKGPISISAYGCLDDMKHLHMLALSRFGVVLNDMSDFSDEDRDNHIFTDLITWTCDHPPPANLMLISRETSDRIRWILTNLPIQGYNVILAHPPNPPIWFTYATTRFLWPDLLTGEIEDLVNKLEINNQLADPKFADAATSVVWLMDGMEVPKGVKPEVISEKIKLALNALNYKGPISITAYGHLRQFPPSLKNALSSTGVVLKDLNLPHLTEDELDDYMVEELMALSLAQKGPANLMLISRETTEGIRGVLETFPEIRYNVILAYPPNPPLWFTNVKTRFLWVDLAKGKYEEQPHS